jgi:hypothetical protein
LANRGYHAIGRFNNLPPCADFVRIDEAPNRCSRGSHNGRAKTAAVLWITHGHSEIRRFRGHAPAGEE